MRPSSLVAWSTCVLALQLAAVAGAQSRSPDKRKKPSPARCVSYSQDQRPQQIDIRLRNRCGVELSCNVSWSLRCDDDAADRKRHEAAVFDLAAGATYLVEASASACGDDGWRIGDVRWQCREGQDPSD
jgi:hypothetical protein